MYKFTEEEVLKIVEKAENLNTVLKMVGLGNLRTYMHPLILP